MRITVEGLELDVEPGVTVRDLVQFASVRGTELPERPWCGPVRLLPDHAVGLPPLVPFARLGSVPGPDARPEPGVHLAVVGGPDAGAVATLAEGLTIGRGAQAQLRLGDPTVSEVHARVARGRIADLGSRNGLTVRGKRVMGRARLRGGDVLRLGDSILTVRDPIDADETESPRRSGVWSLASGGAASLSMVVFAIATGHWVLAVAALAVPLAMGAASLARSRRPAPVPAFDVTGTLGVSPLPAGAVAVRGPRGLLRAVTLVTGRPPAQARHWEPWMELLPPATHAVTWLEASEEPPSWVQVLVEAVGADVTVTAQGTSTVSPLPLVSEANAEATARRLAARADASALPPRVTWGQLPSAAGELVVRLGMGANGPVALDLVADGPHILVAGTTGSGKSEALRTIIGSLAHDHSPEEVTFALIDFKGGAGLGACASLPHVGSVLTDLEPHLARRCLLALAAELADRKRAAAAAGASAFDEWRDGRPPRLVVVIDEFQEIASADRDFLPQLARLAAQGRSLGIHLVLATQRPAGAVGAEIRANISATLALRTASESESRDVLGSADAALIPADVPGRAVLMRGGAMEAVQVAMPLADPPAAIRVVGEAGTAGRGLLEAACARHSGRTTPLWLAPLPAVVGAARGAPGLATLGVADLPAARQRAPLTWDPSAGPLVVAGPPRSGRTSVLTAIGAQAEAAGLDAVLVPPSPRLAVRTLALALEGRCSLLLIDDAARLLSGEPDVADLLAVAMQRLAVAMVVPGSWGTHRVTTGAGVRLVFTGLGADFDAAWDVPRELRGLPPQPGRVRAQSAEGWHEAQLAVPDNWEPVPLVRELPIECPPLPASALGIGGDMAEPVLLQPLPAAVVGPPGTERDMVAKRVAMATGIPPLVADSPFTLGAPGLPTPRIVIVVRPTARSVRECMANAPAGLVDPHPLPLRAVAIIDGVAQAVQVAPHAGGA